MGWPFIAEAAHPDIPRHSIWITPGKLKPEHQAFGYVVFVSLTYSPYLNPIERFWLQFKQLAVANCLHRSQEVLDQSVTQMMADQNTLNHPNRLRFLDKFRLVASRLPISHGCA